MPTFGETIKKYREEKQLPLRIVAAYLDIDQAILSKIERGERKAKREQVPIFAKELTIDKDDLLSLWLADQIYNVVKDENMALKAIRVAEEEIKYEINQKIK